MWIILDYILRYAMVFFVRYNVDKIIKKLDLKLLYTNEGSVVYRDLYGKYVLKKFTDSEKKDRICQIEAYNKEKFYLLELAKHEHIKPYIPKVLEYDDFEYFIVMEFRGLDGIDLLNRNLMTRNIILRLINQVGNIVNDITSVGMIHRDIKPENIVYSHRNKQWSIIDFTFMESKDSKLVTFKGTYPYCAPFLGSNKMYRMFLEHNKYDDAKECADYYSFSMTVFSILLGEHSKDTKTGGIDYDLDKIYEVMDSDDKVLKALAKVTISCVDTNYRFISWIKRRGRSLCVFHTPSEVEFNEPIDRNVKRCWDEFMSIIGKRNVSIVDDVQIENKSE